MEKQCTCKEMMHLTLRSVIFQKKVEIINVPVFTCPKCDKTEVMPLVKNDLTKVVHKLGNRPAEQKVSLSEFSEITHLILQVTNQNRMDEPVEKIIEDRINELLDMMLLAQSLKDHQWMKQIRKRLTEIMQNGTSTYDLRS
jgi:hypothetical protein